jgi:hypothetical protein
MSKLSPELNRLGDEFERAVAAAIAAPRRRRGAPRRILIAAALVAVCVPGLAFAAATLIGNDEVAAGLPAGTKMLQGTEPHCTVVRQDVEYQCVLGRLPANPEVADLNGTVEPTVDRTKHVNGGCRSLRSDGRVWECFIGRAAVDEQIIGAGFLGQYAPYPGVGRGEAATLGVCIAGARSAARNTASPPLPTTSVRGSGGTGREPSRVSVSRTFPQI